ncbi:ABC transporter substrate-binding protein [Amycolatopsis alkalitolerans]|uniref:ABC transporter substrate-binding protein n=1 Tax=Amycolatopsis alkalitolerans TaxID=2547244 RepID=A0A5C4LQ46_9PSEU|nr:ABC transporter substrate-binding protein [Amycolatopsis alkalitolerans]TNC20229.1 ABC transporter substrate-binding protein [Amycolatopsis alkalitolerans]
MFRFHRKWAVCVTVVAAGLALTTGCAPSGNGAGASQAADARQVSVLPAGVSLAGGPGTPQPKPLPSRETLQVGIPSKLELEAPALLAKAYGQFEKENLDVTFVTDTVPNLLTLLGQNKVDLVYAGAQALVFNALRHGVPIRWVSGVASSAPDSGVYMSTKYGHSAADFDPKTLKGKNIGVNPGGLAAPSEYGLYELITKGGLSPGDVQMTPFKDISAMAQALNSGSIDGATLGPPYTAGLEPGASFLAESVYPASIQIAGYFATTSLLDAHRAAGVAFFRALERTVNTYLTGDYHQNADVMAAMAKELGASVASLKVAPSVPFDFNVPAQSVDSLQQMYRAVPNTLQSGDAVKPGELVDLSLVIDAAQGK